MLKYALVLIFMSLARGQNANSQSQVQQAESFAFGQNQSPYAQNQGGQAQSAYAQSQLGQTQSAAAQAMAGMSQAPGGFGQWQNPYMSNYYQNQGVGMPLGGAAVATPMMEGRRFYGGYASPAIAVGPPVLGAPVMGAPVMGPPVVGMGYGMGYFKRK